MDFSLTTGASLNVLVEGWADSGTDVVPRDGGYDSDGGFDDLSPSGGVRGPLTVRNPDTVTAFGVNPWCWMQA